MGYKIVYAPEAAQRYPDVPKKVGRKAGKWIGFVLILAAALWLRVYGIPDFLIPGDPQVTKTAVVEMVEDIRQGAPVNEAITVFCRSIIDGAQI